MQCAARWCHVDAIRAFPSSRWRWDIASSWRETFFARLQTNEYKWNRILLCIYCTVLQQFFFYNPDPIRSDPLDDVLNVRKNHRLTSLHRAVSLNIFIHYKSSSIKATFEGETISGNKFFFRLFPSSPSSTLIEHSGDEFDVLANTAMMFVDLSISRQNISPKIQLFVENSHAIKIISSSVLAANKLPLSGGEEKWKMWRKRTDRHGLYEFWELGHTSVSARVDDWSRKTRFYFLIV